MLLHLFTHLRFSVIGMMYHNFRKCTQRELDIPEAGLHLIIYLYNSVQFVRASLRHSLSKGWSRPPPAPVEQDTKG